jgi:hypothetical protein
MTVRRAAVAGFFFGAATACRSTSALFLLAAGLHVLAYHRRAAGAFTLRSTPGAAERLPYRHIVRRTPLTAQPK